MSVPSSMVHRSVNGLVVRSLFDPPPLQSSPQHLASTSAGVCDVESVATTTSDGDADEDDAAAASPAAGLPDCKVKRNYTCSACDFFTQNPRQYLYHLRDSHNEKVKIYECPSCLYASRHFQKLLRHNKMVHGSSEALEKARRRPPQQDMEQPEDSEDGGEDHPMDPNAPSPAVFKCSVCDFTTKYQATLAKHESEQHFKTKFFRCGKCTYVTHIKARYTKHVKYHSMPMIKCDIKV
ncbi:unnamed protein product [Acanthoscelides obtectus]|uniref:C2H2-type domain-containing protein n=1 Tax=Acanthoscelides obtectus TaxID=200917 RepID=A0A9P0L0C2_ACAOB|nr:unnamed protein product [Acanthoscelides obtectus]CAK1651126.1 RE1-silencing transcription factor A [Acanthoscelides obtectus]